jgi:hypothetical protein
VQDGATALAFGTFADEVSPEELQRLVDEGYIDPEVVDDLALTAFEYGALMARLPEAAQMSFPQFAAHMRRDPVPLSKPEQEAVAIARQRAGQFCRGLGNRYSDELGRIVVNADAELAQQLREGIAGEVAESIANREGRNTLVRRLREMSGEMTRDWTRIANTETHIAHQEGFFESTVAHDGDGAMMAKVPERDACPDCLRLYLGPDGKPIIRPASWWASHGSNNVGRKRVDWEPVLGAMHPWCRCEFVNIPEGFEFDEGWSLVPISESGEPVEKALEKAHKLQGRRKFQGFEVSIENRIGSVRRWHDPHTGRDGKTRFKHAYGYIRGTMGVDGDQVDVFLGPDESAEIVYVIHQMKAPNFDEWDEDKCLLGFSNALEARRAYRDHYDDPRFFGGMTPLSLEEFRRKVFATKDRPQMIKAPGQQEFDFVKGPEFNSSTGALYSAKTAPVGTMGNHSSPARTAGANVLNRDPVTEWPPLKKRPKRKRRKMQRAAERFDIRGIGANEGGRANPPRLEQVQAGPGKVERDIERQKVSGQRYMDELEGRQRRRAEDRESARLQEDLQEYHRGSKP